MKRVILKSTGEAVRLADEAQPKRLRRTTVGRTAVLIKGHRQVVLNKNLRFTSVRPTLGVPYVIRF